jgi:glutamine amidotransferase
MENQRKRVVIIDYQLGNLFSVKQACDSVGIDAIISSDKNDIINADALILPGVGAFNEAMNNLTTLDILKSIKTKVQNSTPIFGICLGLQLLFTESEEFGSCQGLDLIPGIIKRFPLVFQGRKIKVPHISWNTIVKANQVWNETPLNELNENEFMYFIHSYYVSPNSEVSTLTTTNYDGIDFCSSVLHKNIFATQFHPEKSGIKGVSIYKQWALINKLI